MKGGYLIIDCGGANLGTMTSLPAGTFNKIASCVGKPVLLNNFILGSGEPVTGAFGAVGLQSGKYIIEVVADAQLFTLQIDDDDSVTATPMNLVVGTLPTATKTKAGMVKMADIQDAIDHNEAITSESTIDDIAIIIDELCLGLKTAGIVTFTKS